MACQRQEYSNALPDALRAAVQTDQLNMTNDFAEAQRRKRMDHGASKRRGRQAALMDKRAFLGMAIFTAVALRLIVCPPAALADQVGSASGLPIPRYVSLKTDRVNLHEGPSKDHRTIWVFLRAGLPVEITAEFEIWRKVRDSEGTEGWVLHSLLSGRRTALVTPWKKGVDSTLYEKPSAQSATAAILQPNVIVNVRGCDGTWCRVWGDGFKGYIRQSDLWGVYPNEKIE
jgi:SH3-like domain-containing protein